MPRIRVDPDQLRMLAKQLRETIDLLRNNISSSNRTYMGLDWDARQKVGMEDQIGETKGTVFYRLHKSKDIITLVLTLVAHGCPLPPAENRLKAEWDT